MTEIQQRAISELARRKAMRERAEIPSTSASERKEVIDDITELRALLRATSKAQPAKEDIAKLKAALAAAPKLADVLGNLAEQAELQILNAAIPNDPGFALAVSKRCELQRNELGFEDASAIERALIEHVVLCWLRLYVTELRYETNMKTATWTEAEHWERKLSTNQRRYLRAVETLARVRKLNISIQFNVAQNQIVTS